MANKSAFVLPEGISLEIDSDTLSLTYDGDVVLESALGRSLGTVRASGDLTVHLPEVQGNLEAGGTLTVSGEIATEQLRGANVHIREGSVKARAIAATRRIEIGPVHLTVDVIQAPEVKIHPEASGRVTVIQSNNGPGASKIKGGFSLADYEEMFGNSEQFLADRGLSPLGDAPPPEPEAPEEPEAESDSADEPAAPEEPEAESDSADEPAVETHSATDRVHGRMLESVEIIASFYDSKSPPEAVAKLEELIHARNYEQLRAEINAIWNGLLKYHSQQKIRPEHKVTTAFNRIHKLLKEV